MRAAARPLKTVVLSPVVLTGAASAVPWRTPTYVRWVRCAVSQSKTVSAYSNHFAGILARAHWRVARSRWRRPPHALSTDGLPWSASNTDLTSRLARRRVSVSWRAACSMCWWVFCALSTADGPWFVRYSGAWSSPRVSAPFVFLFL